MKISKTLCTVGVAMATLSATSWTLTWNPSPGDTNGSVQSYSFFFESTTNQANPTQFGTTNAGMTSMVFDPSSFPNPCYLIGQALGTNGSVSAYSVPYLFNTNSFPGPPSFLHAHP